MSAVEVLGAIFWGTIILLMIAIALGGGKKK